jgi:hypothetical protein
VCLRKTREHDIEGGHCSIFVNLTVPSTRCNYLDPLTANPMRRIASLLRFLIDLHVVGFRRASLEGDRHLFAVF